MSAPINYTVRGLRDGHEYRLTRNGHRVTLTNNYGVVTVDAHISTLAKYETCLPMLLFGAVMDIYPHDRDGRRIDGVVMS